MERDTINKTLNKWDRDISTLITQRNIQLCFLISTIWRPYLRQLVQNKFHLIMNHYLEAEEVFCSFSSILVPSILSQDSVDGHTMNGSEIWYGITNISFLSTWDILKLDISLTSWVQNSQSSTMYIQDMKPNNSVQCGLMFVRKNS